MTKTTDDTCSPDQGSTNKGASLAEQAFERSNHAAIEDAIKQLTPEEAAAFVQQIEASLKQKKVMLWGYLSVVLTLVIGTMWAFYMYGTREPGTFVGWVFLIPLGVAASLIILFGRLARRGK